MKFRVPAPPTLAYHSRFINKPNGRIPQLTLLATALSFDFAILQKLHEEEEDIKRRKGADKIRRAKERRTLLDLHLEEEKLVVKAAMQTRPSAKTPQKESLLKKKARYF